MSNDVFSERTNDSEEPKDCLKDQSEVEQPETDQLDELSIDAASDDKPAADETAVDEALADEPAAKAVPDDTSVAADDLASDSHVDSSSDDEPPADEVPDEEPSADPAPDDEPSADPSLNDDSLIDETTAQDSPADVSPASEPSADAGVASVPAAVPTMPDIPPMETSDEDAETKLALENLEKRRRARRRKRIIKIVVAAVIAAVAIFGFATCGAQPKQNESKKSAGPTIAYAMRSDFETTVDGTGAINPNDIVIVTPEVSGVVESVSVKQDQEVRKGDVLFTLKSDSLDKAVNDATVDLNNAAEAVSDAQEAVGDAKDAKAKAKSESEKEAKQAKSAAKKVKEKAKKVLSKPEKELSEAKAVAEASEKQLDAAGAALEVAQDELKEIESSDPTNVEAINRAKKKVEEKREAYDAALVDNRTAQAELTRAQTAYDKAYAELATSTSSGTGNASSSGYSDKAYDAAVKEAKSGVKTAEQGYEKAQSAYDEAVTTRDKRVVTAPKSGTLVSFGVRIGQAFGESAPKSASESSNATVQIADLSKMKLTINVNESEVTDIKVGQNVRCTFPALPDLEITGKVTSVASTATSSNDGSWSDDGVVTFAVEVLIAQPDPRLRLGMSANVSIITNSVPNAIVVPVAAVADRGSTATVEVVTDEKTMTTETRTVKLGSKSTSEVIIESGLAEGEAVLVPDIATSFTGSSGAAASS